MASSSLGDNLCLAAEMLSEATPLNPDSNLYDFKVTGDGLEVVVRAMTSFEAALRTTFVFWRLGLLSDSVSFRCEHEENLYEYQVIWPNNVGTPRILLRRLIKKPELNPVAQPIATFEEWNEELHAASIINNEESVDPDLLQKTLVKVFGHQSFKPQQRETISSTISGKTVLSIIGTGGGKSLTFMLPAALAKKPTIVVSPTRSLIEDLFDRSQNYGLKSCKFLGGMDHDVLQRQTVELSDYKLIYATPEALEQYLLQILTSPDGDKSIERIVFDEAHTIYTWGSTFRPKYREVSEQLAKLQVPKLLLSATIPGRVQTYLKVMFGSESWQVIAHSVHRDNLTLNVKDRGSKYIDDLVAYVRQREKESGIIYCVLPNDVSKVHAELLKRGLNCVKYHGKLSENVKQSSFQKWMTGECNIIVANASFGMGIDKPNVRYVVHLRLPTSIEEYFQQCGRAGRDGLPADCLLYYSYSDKATLYKLFSREGRITEQHSTLNELVVCIENVVQCRHKIIMQYFGEDREDFSCLSKCDNCLSRGSYFTSDGTSEAQKIVQTVVELGSVKCNCNVLKLILIGSKQKKIQEQGYDELSNFGCLAKNMSSVLVDKFLHTLIQEQILQETVDVSTKTFSIKVSLGAKAHDLLALRCSCTKFVPSH